MTFERPLSHRARPHVYCGMEQFQQHMDDDVERYRPRIFGVAYRMLGDAAEAEAARLGLC